MEIWEEALARLKGIIDLLAGGGAEWLCMDDRAMANAFGADKTTAAQRAEEFARQNDCAFRYEPDVAGRGDGVGRFSRAYSK